MATYSRIPAGKSHGQRSLVGSSLCGRKESDTTEQLSMHTQPSLERGHRCEGLEKVREELLRWRGSKCKGLEAAAHLIRSEGRR